MLTHRRAGPLIYRAQLAPLAGVLMALLTGVAAATGSEPGIKLNIIPPSVCDCGTIEKVVLVRLTTTRTRLDGRVVRPEILPGQLARELDPYDPLFVYVDEDVPLRRTYALFKQLRDIGLRVRLVGGEHAPDFVTYFDSAARRSQTPTA